MFNDIFGYLYSHLLFNKNNIIYIAHDKTVVAGRIFLLFFYMFLREWCMWHFNSSPPMLAFGGGDAGAWREEEDHMCS